MAGSIRLEKAGKPVAYLVADNFSHDAISAAEDSGMPGLRIIGISSEAYYKNRINREEIQPQAAKTLNPIIEALTRPLTSDEIHPPINTITPQETLTITGKSYSAVLENFNQHFLDEHWGSGLPLLPPTREQVQWMLTGTHRPPETVIGKVAPKNGIATIEKIAVNAVMAGAKPEYLPVIIAVMEAVTNPRFDLLHMTASTGSFSLHIMVNGPIAEEIGMNWGIGLMGYGWRANNTIGHAIRLCLINLGHVWPAENDMALIGRASSHTCHVFAENEKQSPWRPYHVLQGYAAQDDCVTVSTAMNPIVLGGGAVEPWTPNSLLANMVEVVHRSRKHMALWKKGSAIPSPMRYTFVIHPELAVEFDRLGYDQRKLSVYLCDKTSIPFEELSDPELDSLRRRIAGAEIPPENMDVFEKALQPGGRIPLLLRPEDCHFAVAGGVPGYTFVTSYFSIPPYSESAVTTQKIER